MQSHICIKSEVVLRVCCGFDNKIFKQTAPQYTINRYLSGDNYEIILAGQDLFLICGANGYFIMIALCFIWHRILTQGQVIVTLGNIFFNMAFLFDISVTLFNTTWPSLDKIIKDSFNCVAFFDSHQVIRKSHCIKK